jgi:hypothetical protein
VTIELRDLVVQLARDLAAARSGLSAKGPPASSSSEEESRGATALFIEGVEIELPAYVAVSGSRILLGQTPVNRTFARLDRIGRVTVKLVPTREDEKTT